MGNNRLLINVGYLTHDPARPSPEEQAGWEFLRRQSNLRPIRLRPEDLPGPRVLWWHFDSSLSIPAAFNQPGVIALLQSHLKGGGSLLLSLLAAQYVVNLGLEEMPPNIVRKGLWPERSRAPGYPDIRGVSSFQGHPIFAGLHQAAYTWTASGNQTCGSCFYEDPALPARGRVVAVERQYIRLAEQRRIICEYAHGRGRVLTVGAHFYFSNPADRFRPALEQLALNCLTYLHAARPQGRRTYWSFDSPTVQPVSRLRPVAAVLSKPSQQEEQSGPVIVRQTATPNSFDTGGRRILILGTERTGITEVWAHPVRVMADVRTGFRVGSGPLVWSGRLSPRVTVRPESITREFRVGTSTIRETIIADTVHPGGTIRFETDGNRPIAVLITGVIDLRLMWPLPAEATGSVEVSLDPLKSMMAVRAPRTRLSACIGGVSGEVRVSWRHERGRGTRQPVLRFRATIFLTGRQRSAHLTFAGSGSGSNEAEQVFRRIASAPSTLHTRQVTHWKRVLTNSTHVLTPDPRLNDAYRWAICALDRFVATTPRVGTSVMAGYGPTDRGWDGGHAVSGRPGYAWYFGRDSVWMGLAFLAAGRHDIVKEILAFLRTYQESTGKILHEMTTSGHVHYDAADATPLYVLLLGRYLRATGDAAFVRECYGSLVRAVEFCLSTDTDRDHLIENTNVGHGWVEGGRLFPVHAELYLNACWSAALIEAAVVARRCGHAQTARRWMGEGTLIRTIIERKFWNRRTRFYNFGLLKSGSFRTERTVMAGAAGALIPLRPRRSTAVAEALSSVRFAAPWGVRLVSSSSRIYNPEGYHYGSIWPLFTGWASLAAYAAGLPGAGFRHLTRNIGLFNRFSAGATPEVLHGERCRSAGVCDHQGWSEAMVVLPVLAGMFGLHPDAPAGVLHISPSLPAEWPFLLVEGIRIGDALIDVRLERRRDQIEARARLRRGQRVVLVLRLPGVPEQKLILRGRRWKSA